MGRFFLLQLYNHGEGETCGVLTKREDITHLKQGNVGGGAAFSISYLIYLKLFPLLFDPLNLGSRSGMEKQPWSDRLRWYMCVIGVLSEGGSNVFGSQGLQAKKKKFFSSLYEIDILGGIWQRHGEGWELKC